MAKNSVAVQKESALPAFISDEFAGLGNSERAQDNIMPFLAIIQKGSPQLNRQKPEFIDGAQTGMMMNTATGKLYSGDEGIPLIPFAYQTRMVEWVPRSAGGGFVAQYMEDDPVVKTAKPKMVDGKQRGLILPNGNDLVLTAYTFVVHPDELMPMVIGAASSALKPMRKWMSMRNSFRNDKGQSYASFARLYYARTVYQENESGDWYNWQIEDGGWNPSEVLYKRCAEWAMMAAKGEMQVGRPPDEYDSGASDPGNDVGI